MRLVSMEMNGDGITGTVELTDDEARLFASGGIRGFSVGSFAIDEGLTRWQRFKAWARRQVRRVAAWFRWRR